MKLKDTAKSKAQIYCDIDGVLANFVKGVIKLIPDYDEKRYHSDTKYRNELWDKVGKYSEEGGELWAELPTMDDAMELWNFLKPYKPQILSATGRKQYGAAKQKKAWIKTNIDKKVKVNLVTAARLKAAHGKKGDILIDDQLKALNPWKSSGKIGILHTSAADTIKQLKKLGY